MITLRKLDVNIVLLLLLTLFVAAPLARPGFPATGAGFQPVWDLNVLARCGEWPAANAASGMVRGDGLLPLYAARVFQWLGAESGNAIKWSLALAYFTGGLAVYGWLRRRWGPSAALIAGVIYTFLPYRLAVTYVAGGLSDAWAMALYPLAGWAIWSFSARATWSKGLWALAMWLLLALVNLGLAMCFALLAGLALLAAGRPLRALIPLTPALPLLVWGLVISAPGDFADHYPYLFQLFSASWHSAPSGAGWIAEMPFQLGLLPLGLAFLGIASLTPRENGAGRRPVIVLAIGVLLAILLSLRVSDLFWRATHLNGLLSYPWQMLGFASLGLSLLAGAGIRQILPLSTWPWLSSLIALIVVSVYGYLSPAWTEQKAGDWPAAIYGQNQAALIDYQFTGHVYPGAEVQLDVIWQCLNWIERDYTVFVQAIDPTQQIWGQQDTQPRGGASPTSDWLPGQIITDTYTIEIDPDGPADGYQVIMGFYDGQTGERLIAGGDDKTILSTNPASRRIPWPCEEHTP
jgi:hypothetical protein